MPLAPTSVAFHAIGRATLVKSHKPKSAQSRGMQFKRSKILRGLAHTLIPGGAHTYAKGDDQFPVESPGFIARGEGCHVWDVDGNEFIEYGMGLRSVTLGHGFEPVVQAAYRAMSNGTNFTRPSPLEVKCAQEFLSLVPGADMVKFAKNGSDVTTAAVRLARAFTGRDLVAVCEDHPFFSVDDWFIGSTPVRAGIPSAVQALTLRFKYNDIEGLRSLFRRYPGQIACVMLEAEKTIEPKAGYFGALQRVCRDEGAVFVLDEIITGFRWHLGGAQKFYGFTPDLSTWGKGMSNGFAVAALAGRRAIMRLGGLDPGRERTFLLSYTHGAETHGLAAALEVMKIYNKEDVVGSLWRKGELLRDGVQQAIEDCDVGDYFKILGKPCALVWAALDAMQQPSQQYRTLFLQELVRRGILAPSFLISLAHSEDDIARTVAAVHASLRVYRRAIDEGIEGYLVGRPVKPVWRGIN